MDTIRIRGARTHNLKNLNLELPRNKLVVVTGLSGSGKSSLAFDTLYAEGQRRYVESLSAYARQFLQLMEKPDVDLIEGLSPAIAIEQKAASHNPRSTVGTVTEIHDYLRLLFARVGTPHCPDHAQPLEAQSVAQMVDHVLALPENTRLMILAPLVAGRKGEQADLFEELRAQGFTRVRVDGKVFDLDAAPRLTKNVKHTVDVVVDRLKARGEAKQRLAESFETALRHAAGRAIAVESDSGKEHLFLEAPKEEAEAPMEKPAMKEAPTTATSAATTVELTQVKGIGEKRATQLKALGINSVNELANASAKTVAKKLKISPKIVEKWISSAKELVK